ncbi:type IV secretory system conjugative DNA transfer family protein [Pelagibius sp. Alg239-R121]|uniref:type IV secretory system conjugative DNA transfer family protein n=1 Tax=Pelagibius sp. Alg239-R121 TaxID=2993448 RepID=UPI0024A6E5B2|nr:type IV secretory system conjugative DNA transfer family protein [Pelagibius sp. Alg239-R121]
MSEKLNLIASNLMIGYIEGFEPAWFIVLCTALFLIILTGIAPLILSATMTSFEVTALLLRRTVLAAFGLLVFTLLAYYATLTEFHSGEEITLILSDAFIIWAPAILLAPLLGLAMKLAGGRYLVPRISALLRSWRVQQSDEKPSDMREEIDAIKPLSYLPADYDKPGKVFTGKTIDGQPLYIALDDWKAINKTVVGATRFGKGVTFQIWIEQAILRGETVFMIDPKGDEFLPEVMRQTCRKAGRRFIYLNLEDPNARGKWGPFLGSTPANRRSRFYSVMDLEERGTDADHYKALTREVLFDFFQDGEERPALRILHEKLKNIEDEELWKNVSTVRARLKEWSGYKSLNPKPDKGFSIEQTLMENTVVYVRGSLEDAVIRNATKALIIEILQEVRRLAPQRKNHLNLFIDELRFLISTPIVDALATILQFNATITTAYQNFGDLRTPVDSKLDGRAIEQAVKTNSQIKVIFGGQDPDVAEYVAETSGKLHKKVARYERTEINSQGGESWGSQRMISDLEEAVIPENTVLALPKRVAVYFQPGQLAKIISLAPVPIEPKKQIQEAAE